MDNLPQEQSETDIDKSTTIIESENKETSEKEAKNTPKKKITKRKILLFLTDVISIVIILLIVYKVWVIPRFIPSLLYKNSNELSSEIKDTVEGHFYSDELGTTVNVSYATEDFQKEYVSSYEKYELSNTLQSMLFEMAGFKKSFPIYQYEMSIPLIVELPEYDIVGTADASISADIQIFSGLGSFAVETVSYSSDLYELSEQLNVKSSIPAEINNAVVIEDNKRDPIILISYTWTNTTNDYASPLFSVMDSAYQNDIELDDVFSLDNENYDMNNINTEIAPGETLEVNTAYYLEDTYSPVVFEMTPFTIDDNPPKISKTFELNDLERIVPEQPELPVEIGTSEYTQDSMGNPIVIISYTWTNTNDDFNSADFSVMPVAFQNGIELTYAYLYDLPYDLSASSKNVMPGNSIEIKEAYYLSDIFTPVEFYVSPFVGENYTTKSTTFYFDGEEYY